MASSNSNGIASWNAFYDAYFLNQGNIYFYNNDSNSNNSHLSVNSSHLSQASTSSNVSLSASSSMYNNNIISNNTNQTGKSVVFTQQTPDNTYYFDNELQNLAKLRRLANYKNKQRYQKQLAAAKKAAAAAAKMNVDIPLQQLQQSIKETETETVTVTSGNVNRNVNRNANRNGSVNGMNGRKNNSIQVIPNNFNKLYQNRSQLENRAILPTMQKMGNNFDQSASEASRIAATQRRTQAPQATQSRTDNRVRTYVESPMAKVNVVASKQQQQQALPQQVQEQRKQEQATKKVSEKKENNNDTVALKKKKSIKLDSNIDNDTLEDYYHCGLDIKDCKKSEKIYGFENTLIQDAIWKKMLTNKDFNKNIKQEFIARSKHSNDG